MQSLLPDHALRKAFRVAVFGAGLIFAACLEPVTAPEKIPQFQQQPEKKKDYVLLKKTPSKKDTGKKETAKKQPLVLVTLPPLPLPMIVVPYADSLEQSWHRVIDPPQGWSDSTDQFFTTPSTSHRIRYRHIEPEDKKRGIVILTGGYGESLEMYNEAVKEYRAMNYAVWAMDWYGFGKSGRDDPGHPKQPGATGMRSHADDLHYFVTRVVKRERSKPLILSTNSMGGHIGMLYLQTYPNDFTAAIMSTPLLALKARSEDHLGLRTIFTVASALGFKNMKVPGLPDMSPNANTDGKKGLKDKHLDLGNLRDKARNYIRLQHPDLEVDNPTIGWAAAYLKTADSVMDATRLRRIKTRVLIGSADHEDIVGNVAQNNAAGLIPHAQRIVLKDSWHGLFFESEKNNTLWFNHIRTFLDSVTTDASKKKPARSMKP